MPQPWAHESASAVDREALDNLSQVAEGVHGIWRTMAEAVELARPGSGNSTSEPAEPAAPMERVAAPVTRGQRGTPSAARDESSEESDDGIVSASESVCSTIWAGTPCAKAVSITDGIGP